jgi:hypothetical protein
MVKISTIFGLGIFIAIIPFTGFPNDSGFPMKNFLYVVCGLTITALSVLIRRELEEVVKHLYTHNDVIKTDTFSESNPKPEEKTEETK